MVILCGKEKKKMAYVSVNFTHNIHPATVMEKRILLTTTIGALKNVAHGLFGSPPETMRLVLKDEYNATLADMSGDDYAVFGFYSPETGCTVHVVDTDSGAAARVSEYTDVSKVEKYEISEEEYAKRANSGRAFKESILAHQAKTAPKKEEAPVEDKPLVDMTPYSLSARCKVFPGDRLGTVRWVGQLDGKKVPWVGVQLDEPTGKNDGSVKGKRYFECPPNYGCFAQPEQVTVGDFPPEEL